MTQVTTMRCAECGGRVRFYTTDGVLFEHCRTCRRDGRVPLRSAPRLPRKHDALGPRTPAMLPASTEPSAAPETP